MDENRYSCTLQTRRYDGRRIIKKVEKDSEAMDASTRVRSVGQLSRSPHLHDDGAGGGDILSRLRWRRGERRVWEDAHLRRDVGRAVLGANRSIKENHGDGVDDGQSKGEGCQADGPVWVRLAVGAVGGVRCAGRTGRRAANGLPPARWAVVYVVPHWSYRLFVRRQPGGGADEH